MRYSERNQIHHTMYDNKKPSTFYKKTDKGPHTEIGPSRIQNLPLPEMRDVMSRDRSPNHSQLIRYPRACFAYEANYLQKS
jgi:hypothetical protein